MGIAILPARGGRKGGSLQGAVPLEQHVRGSGAAPHLWTVADAAAAVTRCSAETRGCRSPVPAEGCWG